MFVRLTVAYASLANRAERRFIISVRKVGDQDEAVQFAQILTYDGPVTPCEAVLGEDRHELFITLAP